MVSNFNLFLKTGFLIILSLLICNDLHSQYGPFWGEERKLSEYTLYKDYVDIITHFNDEQNASIALKAIDSLAQKALSNNDYEQYLFLKNEVSNFYKSDSRFEEGYTDLYNAMRFYSDNKDTLTIEYVASQRLLRTMLTKTSYESRGEGELLQSQLAVLDKLGEEGEPLRNTLVDYGLFLIRQGKTNKAINILYDARSYALEADDLASLALADYTIIVNLPPIYDIQETTMEVLKNDIALLEQAKPTIPVLIYSSFFNYLVGNRYYNYFDDLEKGIYYTKKAIACLDTIALPAWNLKASCHSNLSMTYADLNDTTRLLKHYKESKTVADTRPMSDYNKSLAYVNIADAVLAISADSALVLLDSIKNQPGARFFEDKIVEIEAKALINSGEKESAIKLIVEKFDNFESIEGYKIPAISDQIDYYNQIHFLSLVQDTYKEININDDRTKQQIIANLIIKQNQLYLDLVKRDIYGHELSNLVSTYHDFLMPSLLYMLSIEDGAKYEDVLQLVFSSKALQLHNNLFKSRIQSQMESNSSFFSELIDNSNKIQNVRTQLAQNRLSESQKSELRVELNSLLVNNMMLRYQADEIQIDEFFIPTLAQVQEKLNPGEGILEYNINDTTLIRTLITKNNAKTSIKHFDDLSEKISGEIHAIKTGRQTTGIGEILLGDLEDEILNLQHITIIPDNKLNYIPFEWLVLPVSGKMLIEKLPVSYNYSTSLWYLLRDETSIVDINNILTVAPVFQRLDEDADDEYIYISQYRGNESFSPLYYSKKEVVKIDSLFTANGYEVLSLINSDATIINTKKNLEKFDIVHIATHGLVNVDFPERSGLFLYPENKEDNEVLRDDNFLSLGELLSMNLRANLAVLSACDTGTGEFAKGEGVMALPRGFVFAGVPNVIATLWSVHDERTKELMTAFYSHLLAGNSYSEALRLAKLDSIQNGALPVDWAGFIFIGTN